MKSNIEVELDKLIQKKSTILKNYNLNYLSKISSKGMLIDLFFISNDKVITTFEIKLGGNLDVKNSKINRDEVLLLENNLVLQRINLTLQHIIIIWAKKVILNHRVQFSK